MDFESLLAGWDGEHAVVRHDAESGAWMFVCVHSTVLGPAGGGTRLRVYPAPADGLADAMRLSGAMTWKMAAAGMPRGGGKAVLAVPELPTGEPRKRLLRRYGELVASLGGTYRTAGDMNISPEDLDVVAETCPWVYGTTGRGGNSGRGTARGALHAIRATVEHVFGSPELAGRSVLVQGAGAVGAVLARELADGGARVLVSDVDESRAAATGCETVPVGARCSRRRWTSTRRAPSAARSTPSRSRASPAARSPAARTTSSPSPRTPSGSASAASSTRRTTSSTPAASSSSSASRTRAGTRRSYRRRLARIGDTLRTLFAEAEAEGITPAEAADRLVRRRLAEAA